MLVSCHIHAGNRTWVLCQCSYLTAELSLKSPANTIFYLESLVSHCQVWSSGYQSLHTQTGSSCKKWLPGDMVPTVLCEWLIHHCGRGFPKHGHLSQVLLFPFPLASFSYSYNLTLPFSASVSLQSNKTGGIMNGGLASIIRL